VPKPGLVVTRLLRSVQDGEIVRFRGVRSVGTSLRIGQHELGEETELDADVGRGGGDGADLHGPAGVEEANKNDTDAEPTGRGSP
jgi:hypothetical protein